MEHSYQDRFDHFRKTVAEWHQHHKSTSPGTTARLNKRFAQYEYEYHKAIAEYRKTKRQKALDTALKIVDTAEKEFKLYTRHEFLGTLAK
jgi:vacuolar-type H+-ATPase subunit H